ncbi:putative CDP-alcohol phosphatidyltransferase class-I family protein 3 [Smittium culicis]|uniref:Putative CDP-alcohol phosphatidyltransferase class-I family protein 3 n=1 Tax=Smittium culicis TaxID=133412 RepID=A0A1R1Y130_9FUNG|nr:putative CDP-alcohol phosphatidyltransferase class-I family protein 3 [Smittium culicis]
MLTLLGSLHVLIAYILNCIYAPNLNEHMPSWVYIVQGCCLWIYMTLDAIDGKQARRTGQSGPLGELFDHGCDSLTAGLALTIQATSLLYGCTWKTVTLIMLGLTNFYVSTLEEYHTGILYIGYFSGPVEGLIFETLTLITTGFYGPQVWLVPFVEYVPSLKQYFGFSEFLLALNLSDSVLLFLLVGIFPTIFASYKHIFRAKRELNLPVSPAFIDLLPLIVYLASVVAWLLLSPNLLQNHFLLFFSFVNYGFSYIVGRVIVAHVSKAEFPTLNRMNIPVFVGLVNSILLNYFHTGLVPRENEVYLVYACLAFSLIQYFHFALTIIDVICSYLDINCLSIKHKKSM